MSKKTILVIGTFDTKSVELEYLAGRIRQQGGEVLTMDVSVLGEPQRPTDLSKHDVAAAGGMSIDEVIALGDEHRAFQVMTRGAVDLVASGHRDSKFDGMIALGGTMGTDLALDCAKALPMGVPKYIVSTVACSPLIEPNRLAADVQMILWAGGLFGMNQICKSSLSQAAGAVLGAARAVEPPTWDRSLIGMTSLGSSCLKYMKRLQPALVERGFDVAVFHTTGMGGMAFEALAAEGAFCCVMDFSLQEFVNDQHGSLVSSGDHRVTSAGRMGIPQLVAPGAMDLIDLAGWQDIPESLADRPFHQHNRLIKSSVFAAEERRTLARSLAERLEQAQGPTHFFLPAGGLEEWDREGQEAHDPEGLKAFVDEIRRILPGKVEMTDLDCHINDEEFVQAVLSKFDQWVDEGIVKRRQKAPQ